MRLSKTKRTSMKEHASTQASKKELAEIRAIRKKLFRIRVKAIIPKKEKQKTKTMNLFTYEYIGGYYKVFKHHNTNPCVRKYKDRMNAVRFCNVANAVNI